MTAEWSPLMLCWLRETFTTTKGRRRKGAEKTSAAPQEAKDSKGESLPERKE